MHYNICMGMKKIKREIQKYADAAYNDGYDEGYFDGNTESDVRFNQGIAAERNRIINLFKMLSENELEQGSGQKAKHFREVVDLIKVADMLENAEGFVEDEF